MHQSPTIDVLLRSMDKVLFFVLFIIGSTGIIGFDYIGVPKWAAVVVCVLFLCAYAFLTTLVPVFKLRIDQAADNSYYLGLLFTLTSLGVALIRFSMNESGADAILRNFGIAIATTIFGLALRVSISQFRVDPDDLESESKMALSESVRSLRGELDRSVFEMQSFAAGTKQALQEVYESAAKAATENLPATFSTFETAANSISKQFESTARSFEANTSSIEGSLKRVSTAVEALSERIGVVKTDPEMFDRALQPAFEALNARVTGLANTLEKEAGRLSVGTEALSRLSGSLTAFEQSSENIATSAQKLGYAATSLGDGADAMGRLSQASKAAADAAASYTQQISKVADQQLQQGRDAFDALERAASLLSEKTVVSSHAVDQSARRMAESIASLNEEFSGSSEAVQRVRAELAELATWIIQKIDAK